MEMINVNVIMETYYVKNREPPSQSVLGSSCMHVYIIISYKCVYIGTHACAEIVLIKNVKRLYCNFEQISTCVFIILFEIKHIESNHGCVINLRIVYHLVEIRFNRTIKADL